MNFDKGKIAELKDQIVETSKTATKMASEKIKEAKIDEKLSEAGTTIAQFAEQAGKTTAEVVSKAGETVNNTIAPAVKNAYEVTKEKTTELTNNITSKATNIVDLNGDGVVDQEDMLLLLNDIYSQSTNGIKNISKPVKEICDEYLSRYKDPKKAAEHLIASDIVKCTTSGFLTGFGGVITLPITIPANVASILYVQIRMIASVAYLTGLDVGSDAVQTLVYACLAGISVADVVKQTGIKLGTKMATSLVQKIPGKTLTAINQKVGFRMLTKFGSKGVINIGKMVPVVGAVIGGGFDLVETKVIANRAVKQFFDGNYEIEESEKDEILDAEFNEILDSEFQEAN